MYDIFGRPKSSFRCVIIIFTMFSSWWGVHMSSVMRRFVAGGHFPIFSLTPLKIILTDQNSRVVLLVIDILTSVLFFVFLIFILGSFVKILFVLNSIIQSQFVTYYFFQYGPCSFNCFFVL